MGPFTRLANGATLARPATHPTPGVLGNARVLGVAMQIARVTLTTRFPRIVANYTYVSYLEAMRCRMSVNAATTTDHSVELRTNGKKSLDIMGSKAHNRNRNERARPMHANRQQTSRFWVGPFDTGGR